jgi:AraC family transcriptional regulator
LRIVSWSQAERRIAADEASDFYDSRLVEPWLFHFTTSRLRLEPHGGAFSLKLVLRGAEDYDFGRRRVRLRPGQLMFAGSGRAYGSEIGTPTESLSLFLPDDEAARLWHDSSAPHERVIDAPAQGPAPTPPPIAWRAHDGARQALADLRHTLGWDDRAATELAAETLLAEAARGWRRAAPVDALTGPRRAATREELLARAMRARDLIEDLGGVGCDLDRLAAAACLSRYHFLRVFREAYGCTPGHFARRTRLARAQAALAAGTAPALVARDHGYSRPGSLRRAGRRMLAVTVC